jgi:hypothetical protein
LGSTAPGKIALHAPEAPSNAEILGVRKVPKIYYLNVWNVSDPIVAVNAVVRHFRQPWVLMRKIWQRAGVRFLNLPSCMPCVLLVYI